jgi:hypothetical protein
METIEKALDILSQTNKVRLKEVEVLCQIAQEVQSELIQLECIKRISENADVLKKNAAYLYADAYANQKEGEIDNVSVVLDMMLSTRTDTEQAILDILQGYS